MLSDPLTEPRRQTLPGAAEEPRTDVAARTALKLLLADQQPAEDGAYGDFLSIVAYLSRALREQGVDGVRRQYALLAERNPRLKRLMDGPFASPSANEFVGETLAVHAVGPSPVAPPALGAQRFASTVAGAASGEALAVHTGGLCPPLPEAARLEPRAGAGACQWLDDYVAYSRLWSPLAYEDFHEAVALWLLSTVAAHRVLIPFGGRQYTPLYIALVARTSLYAKSTTARIARRTLRAAGLDWLLLPDESTPQKMIQEMAGQRVPEDYEQLPEELRSRLRRGLAMAGQRGWFYDEFGQKLAVMQREDGPMAEFRGILRRMNDCDVSYEYGTIGRGTERVDQPYLALLANMTPADMRALAKRGSALWGDGTWARFAFVTPPAGWERSRERFPNTDDTIPAALVQPLRQWHERLGTPTLSLTALKDQKGDPIGRYRIERGPLPETRCSLERAATDAYYNYFFALQDITQAHPHLHDLDGNYSRFPEKALRMAALFASLENDGRVELRHWARAQAITERWRAALHALVEQLSEAQPSQTVQNEEKILQLVERRGPITARDVRHFIKGMDSGQAKATLDSLVRAGILGAVQGQQTMHYHLLAQEE